MWVIYMSFPFQNIPKSKLSNLNIIMKYHLKSLHRLKIEQRMKHKILSLTYNPQNRFSRLQQIFGYTFLHKFLIFSLYNCKDMFRL